MLAIIRPGMTDRELQRQVWDAFEALTGADRSPACQFHLADAGLHAAISQQIGDTGEWLSWWHYELQPGPDAERRTRRRHQTCGCPMLERLVH